MGAPALNAGIGGGMPFRAHFISQFLQRIRISPEHPSTSLPRGYCKDVPLGLPPSTTFFSYICTKFNAIPLIWNAATVR